MSKFALEIDLTNVISMVKSGQIEKQEAVTLVAEMFRAVAKKNFEEKLNELS